MSDYRDDNTPGNVIDFGRRTGRTGFTISPPSTGGGGGVTGPVIPPQPDCAPANGTGRRSPLDALAALPSTTSPVVVTHPDGGVPDTFRGSGSRDASGPRLGALSLAAILAVAVAALRGSCIVLEDWRQRRMARAAETAPLREARAKHKLAMAQAQFGSAEAAAKNATASDQASAKHAQAMRGHGDKAVQRRSKRTVPDSHTFGQKTLGNRGGQGGGGGGKGKGAGTGTGSGGADRKRKNTGAGTGRGSGGSGPGRKETGAKHAPGTRGGTRNDRSRADRKEPRKSPHRGSQGAGSALKNRKKSNGNGGPTGSGSGTKNTPPSKKTPKGRTTLRQAAAKQLGKAAQNRLQKRRKNLNNPAVWSGKSTTGNTKTRKQKTPNPNGTPQPGSQTSATPKKPTTKTPLGTRKRRAGRTTLAGAMGHTAYQAAKARLKKRRHAGVTPPVWGAPHRPGTQAQRAASRKKRARQAAAWTTKAWTKARAKARQKATNSGYFTGTGRVGGSQHAGTGPHGQQGAGQQSKRRSPFGNAAASGAATWTVEREDYVGAQAKRWEPDALDQGHAALTATGQSALPAASEPHTKRPGTTRPKEPIPMPPAQDPRLQKARNGAARRAQAVTRQARHMDAQHATEINLDDALDEYGDFKDDGFKTHEQSAKLAGRARQLAATLEAFADELATRHNLIGPLFTGAMANLSEDMEIVARMSDEMQVSSLYAAEEAEQADNDLNDAYRPWTQATADAGLTTPSAPIHNRT